MDRGWEKRFSPYGRRVAGGETRAFLNMVGRKDLISFAGGIPDSRLFPVAALAEAHARILGDPARAGLALQYAASEGYRPLREWIAAHMAGQGVSCGPENILITNGSQQGLYLAGRLFLGAGDIVLTSRPTYLGLLHALAGCEPAYAPLGSSDPLPPRAKLAYAMADFANPTGESLDLPARQALLAMAEENDIVLLEDAAYAGLRYRGAPLPSLLALDLARAGGIEKTRTLYCGTFSKTIIPGLRVGWVVAAAPVIEKLGLMRQAIDFHSSPLSQMVLAEVAARLPQSHLAMLCETYGARLSAMLDALSTHMPATVTWSKPDGGMFVWLTLPKQLDAGALLPQALAHGVSFVPGAYFFPGTPQPNTLRLNFTHSAPPQIHQGIARLGSLIAENPVA
jgi:DNA-binding transcriptional MocR family regulator